MPSWQEPGEISPAMGKPARPFARCLIGAAAAAAARGRRYCKRPMSCSPAWQAAVGTSQGCQGSCQLGQAWEDGTPAGMRMGKGAFTPPSSKALLQEVVGLKHALAG